MAVVVAGEYGLRGSYILATLPMPPSLVQLKSSPDDAFLWFLSLTLCVYTLCVCVCACVCVAVCVCSGLQ